MFWNFFRFELRFWLKSYMVWIFLAVLTAITLIILTAEEAVLEDVFFNNSQRNSPFAISRLYSIAAVFGCLMVTAFVNSAASRDFVCKTQQLIFTKPVKKLSYLMGRFWASTIVSLIPMLGASLAVFFAQVFVADQQWGETNLAAHLFAIFVIAVPNTFFIAAFVFAIAIWTRSALASFLGVLGLMVALSISNALVGSLANEFFAAMSDPFGDLALATQTKYWTIADKNTLLPSLTGVLLWNRVLWVSVGVGILIAACLSFSFSPRPGLVHQFFELIRGGFREVFSGPFHTSELPKIQRDFKQRLFMRQAVQLTWSEIWNTFKSPIFICLIFGVVVMVFASLSVRSAEGFGLSSLPVSFSVVDTIKLSLFEIQIAIITFFAGVYVWKERDAKLDEIFDALPIPSWLTVVSKTAALVIVVAFVFAVGSVCGLLYQAFSFHFDFKPLVYFQQIFLVSMTEMSCLVVLAIVCHVVSPNKYFGYFLFVGLLVINAVLWPILGVESRMLTFGRLPDYVYSDMFGLRPYLSSLFWFGIYWLSLSLVVLAVGILLWQRGRDTAWRQRIKIAGQRWSGKLKWASGLLLVLWLVTAGWVYWNTHKVNKFVSSDSLKRFQARYETTYKELERELLPRVTDIQLKIDLFPKRREMKMSGTQTLANKEQQPIHSMLVTTIDPFESKVDIEGATISSKDDDLKTIRFQFDPPFAPGETREMRFDVNYKATGFENSVRVPQIVQNGTFFNSVIIPQIGYFAASELKDAKDRKKYGLSKTAFAELDPQNLEARKNHYINHNSDWVNLETVISTAGDQIAIAPGSLVKRWKKNGRNHFRYQLDHPSVNFFSFVSAKYQVALRRWNDVDIEVYYHADHQWNVNLMLRSIERSLEYYTKAFGPYRHRQARIIEFPRVSIFAQAFPGTMPYSEGVGFIADLKNPYDIDMVFYVVAHEMAHQWWAHQVIGAKMQGATVLSETLAQYSALMVMEQEYGRDMMRKFLKYEMDNYLRGRGRDNNPEHPLSRVESEQGYIHYNKGSVVMYHLKETIGEERLNAALKELVQRFGYQAGPYPTSLDLVTAIKKHSLPKHHELIDDLFQQITLFENKTIAASYRKIDDEKYEVSLELELGKFYSDGQGNMSEATLDDWIEIGAFAKPGFGEKYGKTLYRKKVKFNQKKRKITFVVDEQPDRVGVDPFSLLIDRNTADNMRQPELVNTP